MTWSRLAWNSAFFCVGTSCGPDSAATAAIEESNPDFEPWFQPFFAPESGEVESGLFALQAAIDDPRRADKAGAILALVGVVNIPIIYFSVKWWNTLHQGSSVNFAKSSMATVMLWGMLLCAIACWMYAIAVSLMRVRSIILERERDTDWVRAELARQEA